MYILKNNEKIYLPIVFTSVLLFSFCVLANNAYADTVTSTIPVRTNPAGVGVNPNTNTIYVSNQFNNTVSVIDGTTNNVVNTISIDNFPLGIAVNLVTNMIYVVEGSVNHPAVAVIDGSTNTVVQTIMIPFDASGTKASEVAVDLATNMIYVTYYSSEHYGSIGPDGGFVAVIDGSTNTYVNSISVKGFPAGIAANQNTTKIYSADYGGFSPGPYSLVSVIIGAANSVAETINVPNDPYSVAVNPNTNMIYVTEANGGKLAVINGVTNNIVTEIPVGSGPIAVSVNPNTNKIYVANKNDDTVSVIDGTTNQVMTTLSVGTAPSSIDVNPNTNQIYVTNYDSNTVTVIDGSALGATAPLSPQNLQATATSSSQINIIWTESDSSVTGYKIERSSDNGSTWSIIISNTDSTATTYSDAGLVSGTTYTYRVSAINSSGTSDPSNIASATTEPAISQPPTGLAARSVSPSQINLIWSAPTSNGGSAITGYQVERLDNGSTWSTLAANTGTSSTTYSDTGLLSNTTYTYRVSAINSVGTSSPSNTASATTPPPVVNTIPVGKNPSSAGINPITNKIYVSNYNNHTVSVIDGQTDLVIRTIPIQWRGQNYLAGEVVVNPIANLVYVTTPAYLMVINGTSDSVINSMFVCQSGSCSPSWIDVNPHTDKIYLGNTNYVQVITTAQSLVCPDTSSTQCKPGMIPIGQWINGVRVNPMINKIYVANGNQTTVVDGSTDNVTSVINVGKTAYHIGVNPNTNMVYVSNWSDDVTTVIDGYNNSVIDTIKVGNGPNVIGVNINTNKIYVANNQDTTVSVIDGYNNSVINTTKVGNGPDGVGVNINTNKIYVTNFLDNTVSVMQDDRVPQTTSLLTVNAEDNNRDSISGIFTVLSHYGYPIAAGHTPTTFTLNDAQTYLVQVSNFGKYVFDYWLDTGSTNASRIISISSNSSIIPVYKTIPHPPTGLTATTQILLINLNWNTPNDNGGSAITGYMIERSTDNGTSWSTIVANTGSTGTTYSDPFVLPQTTYTYRVSAINTIGTSSPSNTASTTTHLQ